MNELKSCPFCGALPYYPTNIKKNKSITHCGNDDCVLFSVDFTVKQWNKRYQPGYHDVDEFYKE